MTADQLKEAIMILRDAGATSVSWEQYWDNDESHVNGVEITFSTGERVDQYSRPAGDLPVDYSDLCFTAGARAIYAAGKQEKYLGDDPDRDYDENAGGVWQLDLVTGVATKTADCWMPEPEPVVIELDEKDWIKASVIGV